MPRLLLLLLLLLLPLLLGVVASLARGAPVVRVPLRPVESKRNTHELVSFYDLKIRDQQSFSPSRLSKEQQPQAQAVRRDYPKEKVWFPHETADNAIVQDEMQLVAAGHVPLVNFMEFQFFGPIQIGNPPQEVYVCYDTGSADLWVPTARCHDCAGVDRFEPQQSTSFRAEQGVFQVQYGSGQVRGTYGSDTVQVAKFVVENCTVGVVNMEEESMARMKADGLLGLAFDGLASYADPPLFFNLINQYPDLDPVFAFYLSPEANTNGSELHIGGFDDELMRELDAEWQMTDVLPQFGLWTFWRVQMHSVHVAGNPNMCAGGCVGFVDSGTSLIGVPSTLYLDFLYEIANFAQSRGCYCGFMQYGFQCFLCAPSDFPTLRFGLGGTHFYLLDGSDYSLCIGLTCIVLVQPSGQDMWVLGDVFMKKYYSLFDARKRQVGFACPKHAPHCGLENESAFFVQDQGASSPLASPLYQNSLSLYDVDVHSVMILFLSGLSLVGSAFIMGSLYYYPFLRQKRVLALLFWLSLCNFVYNALIWITSVAYGKHSRGYCGFQLGVQQFAGMGMLLFSMVISLELLRAVRGLEAETKDYSRIYHLFIWSICMVCALLSLIMGVIGFAPDLLGPGGYCWMGHTPVWARVAMFYVPAILSMSLSFGSVKIAVARLHQTNLIQTESGRRSARLLNSYMLVNLFSYCLPTVLGLLSLFGVNALPSGWLYVNEFCFYSQGFFNCLVWAFSPSFRDAYRSRQGRNSEQEIEHLIGTSAYGK